MGNSSVHSDISRLEDMPVNISRLRALNDEKARTLIPVMVWVAVLMITGIVGNALVCYVYYFKFKKTPANYFVVLLAILDLISCTVGMPFEILDMRNPYMFTEALVCRIMRFTVSVTAIASGLTLIAVAFDRYYKICKPLKRFPNKTAKLLNILSFFLGLILGIPALIVFDIKEVATKDPYITGYECSVNEVMKHTIFPVLYNATLAIVFVLCVIFLAVLYGLLAREIFKRKSMTIGTSLTNDSMTLVKPMTQIGTRTKTTPMIRKDSESCSLRTDEKVDTKNFKPIVKKEKCPSTSSEGTVQRRNRTGSFPIRTGRTTRILFCVSFAFVVSFLPYVVVRILTIVTKEFDSFTSNSAEAAYNFAIRSFFINNAINPIIYSFFNKTFRHQCITLLKKPLALLSCKKQRAIITRALSNQSA